MPPDSLPRLSSLTIWVNCHGRPCDSERHDARKLEVVPKEAVTEMYESFVAERGMLRRALGYYENDEQIAERYRMLKESQGAS